MTRKFFFATLLAPIVARFIPKKPVPAYVSLCGGDLGRESAPNMLRTPEDYQRLGSKLGLFGLQYHSEPNPGYQWMGISRNA